LTRKRMPILVIKATYTTREGGWPLIKNMYDRSYENDPIDRFVRKNYRVIDDNDGFLILVPNDK
jgi:hypothetical protein